jgi:flagellar biosynthesis protein FliP
MEIEALTIFSAFAAIGATAFVKIFTVLSIFRIALGLRGPGVSLVFLLLSAVLTSFVHQESFQLLPTSSTDQNVKSLDVRAQLTPFLDEHTSEGSKRSVEKIREKLVESDSSVAADSNGDLTKPTLSYESLRLAFILDELKEAFEISLLILIPFLLVDLLVTCVFLFLGVQGISVALIALPLKLLGFSLANGWDLLAARLLYSYSGGSL